MVGTNDDLCLYFILSLYYVCFVGSNIHGAVAYQFAAAYHHTKSAEL